MNWQFLVSKPCTVWPYTGTITLLSLPKGLFGDHLQKRQDHKEKIIIIITIINTCIAETRKVRGEIHKMSEMEGGGGGGRRERTWEGEAQHWL